MLCGVVEMHTCKIIFLQCIPTPPYVVHMWFRNRKYQTLPLWLLSCFSVLVCLRCLLHHILSRIAFKFREKWDFVLIIIVQFMMSANSRICYGLQIVFAFLNITPSHYHHCGNLSVDIELMKCLPDIFVERVSEIEHIRLVIHYSIYGAVCFQFTQFPHDGWENILFCLIIIIKSVLTSDAYLSGTCISTQSITVTS